jgi:hypothetical protein
LLAADYRISVGIKLKPILSGLGLAALALLAALAPRPASAKTVNGSGKATIVTPLSLVNRSDLAFGAIVPSASAGTVTVDAYTEARTTSGGVTASGGTVSAAKFDGLSTAPSHLKIDVPNGSITLTRSGGTETMTVNNFELNGNKNDWVSGNDVFEFQVGARLNVGANQAAGTYVGTFNVTVNYR